MIASDFADSDGFKLKFEVDCSEGDKKFFISKYKKIDTVAEEKPHCTTCNKKIGTKPSSEKNIRTHQVLGVTQCNKCFAFYNKDEFRKDENGEECYCRWCGEGGDVFCCSTCPYVFCRKCIRLNLSSAYVKQVEDNDDWSCFVCNKDILKSHRAQHWALRNFMDKQREQIQNAIVHGDGQAEDDSNCCRRKTRKTLARVAPANAMKRPGTSDNFLPVQPPAKKSSLSSQPKQKLDTRTSPAPAAPSGPISSTSPSPAETRHMNFASTSTSSSTSSGKNIKIVTCSPDIPTASMMPSTPIALTPPVLETRKKAAPATATAVRPGAAQVIPAPAPWFAQFKVRPAGPMATNGPWSRTQISTPRSRTLQPQRFTISRPPVIPARNTQLPLPPTPTPSTSTIFKQQDGGTISIKRAPQPNTLFGTAKTEFEDKIIRGMEICQQTINKMMTLSKSTSFKSSKSFADLKDLNKHLQLVVTFSSEKLDALKESIAMGLEGLAKYDADTKEKCDADELEFVEQTADVIEVLSDEEEETAAALKENPSVVEKELEKSKGENAVTQPSA